MDDREKRDTIIREIKYWKQHNLLPETYCDFLLTLYTEGDEQNDPELRKTPKLTLRNVYSIFIVHFLLLITVVVIYFTDFSFVMQIAIGTICIVTMFWIAKKFVKYNKSFAHLFFLVGAITIFLLMVHGAVELFPNSRMAVATVVILNCLGWVVIGFKWLIKYFQVAGILGILLFILFFFINI